MDFSIEPWDGQHSSAVAILDLVEDYLPTIQALPRSEAVAFLEKRQGHFKESTLILTLGGRMCGFGMVSARPSPEIVDLVGVIRPEYRRQGFGSHLLSRLRQNLNRYPEVTRLRGLAFDSVPEGERFFGRHGFMLADVQVWSVLHTDSELPDWARSKLRDVDTGPLRFVRGHAFEEERPDWAESWWRLVTETAHDIPSRVSAGTVPFDEWRPFMDLPHTDRSHSILALDGQDPVGVISMSLVTDGRININYTGVAQTHRRHGLSTALKLKAITLAPSLGAHTIVTQNHQDNPMLILNRRIGFKRVNAMREYLLERTTSD